MFSAVRSADVDSIVEVVLLILALVSLGLAVWAGHLGRIPACIACGILGVVLLVLVL